MEICTHKYVTTKGYNYVSGCGGVTVVSGLSSASSGGMIPHLTVKSLQSAPSPGHNTAETSHMMWITQQRLVT